MARRNLQMQETVGQVAEVDYSGLSWNELQTLAAERGVYQAGMTRKQVEAALQGAGGE